MRMKTAILVVALAATLVVPAVAELKVVVGGNSTYGVVVNLGVTPLTAGETLTERLKFTATIDDYVTAFARIDIGTLSYMSTATPSVAASLANNAVFTQGYLTFNLAKFLKLTEQKIGLTVQGGYFDSADNSYVSTTQYGSENICDAATSAGSEFQVVASYSDLVNLKFAMDPSTANDWIVGLYHSKKYGTTTIAAEVFYDANKTTVAGTPGFITADFEVKPVLGDLSLDVGAGIRYDLATAAAVPLKWGAGVGVTYTTLVNVRAGVMGQTGAMLDLIVADLKVVPVPVVEFLAAMKLDANPTFTFVGADIAAKFNLGITDLYVGGVIKAGNTWAPAAPAAGSNFGPYVKLDVAY